MDIFERLKHEDRRERDSFLYRVVRNKELFSIYIEERNKFEEFVGKIREFTSNPVKEKKLRSIRNVISEAIAEARGIESLYNHVERECGFDYLFCIDLEKRRPFYREQLGDLIEHFWEFKKKYSELEGVLG